MIHPRKFLGSASKTAWRSTSPRPGSIQTPLTTVSRYDQVPVRLAAAMSPRTSLMCTPATRSRYWRMILTGSIPAHVRCPTSGPKSSSRRPTLSSTYRNSYSVSIQPPTC